MHIFLALNHCSLAASLTFNTEFRFSVLDKRENHIILIDELSSFMFIDMSYVWRRKWQPTPVLLPGESYGQRSLVGFSPWGLKESDTTKWLLIFVYLWPFVLFWHPYIPLLSTPSQFVSGPSPGCACTLQSRWISSQRHMVGGIARLTVFWHSLPDLAPRSLLHMCSVSFALRMGNIWPLDLLRVLSLSVPAIRYPVDNP